MSESMPEHASQPDPSPAPVTRPALPDDRSGSRSWPPPCPPWCAEDEDGSDPQGGCRHRWHRRRLEDGELVVLVERYDADGELHEPTVSVPRPPGGHGAGYALEDLSRAQVVALGRLLDEADALLARPESERDRSDSGASAKPADAPGADGIAPASGAFAKPGYAIADPAQELEHPAGCARSWCRVQVAQVYPEGGVMWEGWHRRSVEVVPIRHGHLAEVSIGWSEEGLPEVFGDAGIHLLLRTLADGGDAMFETELTAGEARRLAVHLEDFACSVDPTPQARRLRDARLDLTFGAGRHDPTPGP